MTIDLHDDTQKPLMGLDGRVALVTGASRGLGKVVAIALAKRGARVALNARSEKAIRVAAEEINRTGGRAIALPGDVSIRTEVERLVEAAAGKLSRLDVLVNNASVIGPPSFVKDADPDSWKSTMDTNLNGPFHAIRAALPLLRTDGGDIINIVSGLGQMAFSRFCAYSVSKAGLIQMTRSLAEELRPLDVRVNGVDPGVMDTSMQREIRSMGPSLLGKDLHRQLMELKESGRLKSPGEVAPLVCFLASPLSNHLSGAVGTVTDYEEMGWPG
jgi:NAD(P)-dependent dehydrogenase (short-subunit alcohol dehydrogenase family)